MNASRVHLRRLFEGLEGYVALGMGFGGRFEGETYKFPEGSFAESFFGWPKQQDQLLAKVEEHVEAADVYICPLLRRTRSRKQGTGALGRFAWADVDAQTPSGWERALLGPSSFVVGSGRGQHPYVALPDPVGATELEDLNRRLAQALEADSGWSETKYLRLAGTLNHKPRATGGESSPVDFLDVATGLRDWSLEELRELLPAGSSSSSNGYPSIEPVMPEDVPAYLLERLNEEVGDHPGRQSFWFVAACIDAGVDEAGVMALALEHRPTKEKFGNENPKYDRRAKEIERSIRKIRKDASDASAQSYRSVASGLTRASETPESLLVSAEVGDAEGLTVSLSQPYRDSESESPTSWSEGSDSDPESVTVPERPFALPISDFVALEREEREPMLADADGRTVAGLLSLILLGALGGHGKTTWAIDLLLHLAAGVDYPPFTIPNAISILIIENEGPEQLFAEKLAARHEHFPHELQGHLDICTFDWGGFSLADPEHRQRLVREIAEKEYDLIFGDPLDSLGIEGVGSPEDTRKFLALMKETGLNKTVAWWLNVHPRKAESREALDEVSGAWGGKPDTVFLLRMLDDDRTQIRQPKLRWARRGKGPTLLFKFDPDMEAFTFIGEQSEEERDYFAEVRGLLTDGAWRTPKEISAPKEREGIGANIDTVKAILEQNPDTFESRSGEAAKEVGRSKQATVWQLRPKEADEGETSSSSSEVERPPERDPIKEAWAGVDPTRVEGACDCGRPIVRGTGNTSTQCGICAKKDIRYSDGGIS